MKLRYLPHVLLALTAVAFAASLVALAEQEQPPELGDAIVFDRPAPPPIPPAPPPVISEKPTTATKSGKPSATFTPVPRTSATTPAPPPPTTRWTRPRVLDDAPAQTTGTPSTSPAPTSSGSSDDDGADD